ncbi:MAG: hypothetical protein ACI8UO_000668 [Verrucomicrobiales bacterium]
MAESGGDSPRIKSETSASKKSAQIDDNLPETMRDQRMNLVRLEKRAHLLLHLARADKNPLQIQIFPKDVHGFDISLDPALYAHQRADAVRSELLQLRDFLRAAAGCENSAAQRLGDAQ